MSEVLNLSKKLLTSWGIELIECLQKKPEQQIYECIGPMSQRYVLRLQPYSAERERLWKTLSMYQLPHLGQVLNCQRSEDCLYILERHYDGESLVSAVARSRRVFGLRQILLSLLKITQDLSVLYEKEGLLHLDIKPDNLWVDAYGNVTLIDFGAALTAVHVTDMLAIPQYGTPSYAAPERWQAPNQVGPPADLYSLTEVLKWWLSAEGMGYYPLWEALSKWQTRRQEMAEELLLYSARGQRGIEAYAYFESLLIAYVV